MWRWAVIGVVKVWPPGQLLRKHEVERRCRDHGWLRESVNEYVLKLREA
jgi:hypothetical protein